MRQLELDDSAAPKNKKLDVLKEFGKSENKRSASFVVVGKIPSTNTLVNTTTNVLQVTSMLERAL